MRRIRYLGVPLLVAVVGTLLTANPASADNEVTFVIGGIIGDDLAALQQGSFAIGRSFDSSPIYGGRLGWYGRRFGVEGSVVYSRSSLGLGVFQGLLTADARAIFTEANLVFSLLPGPISPFVTAGAGVHNFQLNDIEVDAENKFGYNFGGGLRLAFGRIGLRFDVRDHITSFDIDDFGLGAEEILVTKGDSTVHNVELSGGVGIRF